MKTRTKIMSIALTLACSHSVFADNKVPFPEYVEQLKVEAKQKGISQPIIDQAFKNVTFKPRAVKADKNQPEKRQTLDEYLPKAVPDWKIAIAKRKLEENYPTLKRISEQYGVAPQYIVALWGVESSFGKIQGNYAVVDALATMSYEGRREEFFKNELMEALQILDEGHISVERMKGSWAGAMGQCQFMPSSFLTFAQDGNGDGKKDIWLNKADVFASTANYLKESGWQDGYSWGRQVKAPKGLDQNLIGREEEKAKKLSEWAALGIKDMNGGALPNVDIDAWLIEPDDENGRAYLIYNNYQVLMKWNRSHYFALSVSILADAIKG